MLVFVPSHRKISKLVSIQQKPVTSHTWHNLVISLYVLLRQDNRCNSFNFVFCVCVPVTPHDLLSFKYLPNLWIETPPCHTDSCGPQVTLSKEMCLCSMCVDGLQEAWSTALQYFAAVARSYRNGSRTFSLLRKEAALWEQSQRLSHKHIHTNTTAKVKMWKTCCMHDSPTLSGPWLTFACRLWKASHWAWLVHLLICLTWVASARSIVGPWSRQRSASPGPSAASAPHPHSNPLLHWDTKR